AGGSMAALAFAKRGLKVLVLEKGENYFTDLEHGSIDTVFSNDELKFNERSFIKVDPLLEPRSFRTGTGTDRDFVGDVNGLPTTVGGGLNHADWKARRLRPSDFHLHDILGDQSGASVVNWPIEYEELEPFYDAVEKIVGVQGPDELPAPFAPPRGAPYPMKPGVPSYVGIVLSDAATSLGLRPFAAPTGITSRPYRGRPPCNDCGFDGNFGCPIGAKGSPAITSLRDAMSTGNVTLLPSSMAFRLNKGTVNGRNGIASVDYFDPSGVPQRVTANIFVLAASPIESARLALLSGFDDPGWGNSSGLLGRNLMFHFQTIAIGVFPMRLHSYRGRAITHMLDDFCGPSEVSAAIASGAPRGGTLELGGSQDVISEGKNYQRGPQHKTLMRISPTRDRLAAMTMQGEDLPQPTNFVDLDPDLKDVYGLPIPRITYKNHAYETLAAAFYLPTMLAIFAAAGTVFAAPLGSDFPRGLLPPELEQGLIGGIGALNAVPGSRHIMGVFRMGSDPATSVTDPFGKFWDLENVYSGDGAVWPTSAGMNPSLTVMALSYRMASKIVGSDVPVFVPDIV
ncbi:MAG: GMC oxidoreductase, partial [Candidatus Binatia bacterium]